MSYPNRGPHQPIPALHVTIPQPAAYRGQLPSNGRRSPYGQPQQQQFASSQPPPRAAFGPPSAASSAETLVNSPNSYNGKDMNGKPMMPIAYPASPSIASFKQAAVDARLTADPDNDRLMPATPGANPNSFWKRFSTVVHENEKKEAMAEKAGYKGGRSAGSEWLHKETGGQKKYRYWVGAVAFLIIAAIVGSLVYHFCFKPDDPNADDANGLTNPTTHDFGLGDGSDDDSAASSSALEASRAAAMTEVDTLSEMPSASAVQAGATLRVRGVGHAANGHRGMERRRLSDLD